MNSGKMLVICPTCEELGRKQVLGEIKDGCFIVMRFHNSFTKIRGEFEVICEICQEPVYFKTLNKFNRKEESNGTMFSIGQSWISGGTFSISAATAESGSITS